MARLNRRPGPAVRRRNRLHRRAHATNKRRMRLEGLEARRMLAAAPEISEFMAKNDAALVDGDGDASDWIEIHNAGDEAIDLAGWHLTDNHVELDRWMFPVDQPDKTMLAPGGYMLVFASGAHRDEHGEPISAYVDAGGFLHAGFRISANGEYLALVGPDGVVSQYGTSEADFPEQFADISYGRGESELLFFLEPTPGEPNAEGVIGIVADEVGFSKFGRTFIEPFDLTLSTESENGTIRYTLDGSEPRASSPAYVDAISVTSTVQVRARVFADNLGPGPLHSEGFIQLAADVVDFTSPLPILVVENFDAGAIPNKRAHNPPAGDGGAIQQVDRQFVQLEFFERQDGVSSVNRLPDLNTRAGVRVRGSSSANFRKKSLSVEAWGEIDDDSNIRPLGMPSESDWILYAPSSEFDRTLMHNTFAYELSREIGRYAVRFRFVEVFLNTNGGPLSMDDHDGVYVFMEKVKRDASRVDVDEMSPNGTTGGWLLQSNRMQSIPVDGTEHPPNFHTRGPNRRQQGPYGRTFTGGTDRGGDDIPTGYNTFLNFESPRGEEINQAQIDSIVSWFDEFEDALYGPDFRDPEKGYRAYIDVGSFIDHMHLTNLTLSFDALQLSTFMFRRSEDHTMELGPVWDFDRAYGADSRAANPTQNLTYGEQFLWMPRLFEDPDYVQEFQDRWQELRDGPFSTSNLHAIIDRQAGEITADVAAANGTSNWPAKVQAMKDWLATRVSAIDAIYLTRPTFEPSGTVQPDATVNLISPDGAVYYTTDGTDPRGSGGAINPRAVEAPGSMSAAITLVAADAAASAMVPDEAFDATYGMTWNGQNEPFDDSEAAGWKQGQMGVGFDENDTFLPLIGLDLLDEMLDKNASLYSRVEFSIDAAQSEPDFLRLNMRYDDGFIAYLNGVEVARANVTGDATWDAAASGSQRDSVAVEFEAFDIRSGLDLLRRGQNVLAIHGVNRRASGNDMLIQAQLQAGTLTRTEISAGGISAGGTVVARSFDDGQWSGPVVLEVARAGDANSDGVFDASDLLLVFQAGEFEDDVDGNSTFSEGDWNLDGDFNSSDLVFAFRMGGYTANAEPALSLALRLLGASDRLHWEAPTKGRAGGPAPSLLTSRLQDRGDPQRPLTIDLQDVESVFEDFNKPQLAGGDNDETGIELGL